MLDVLQLVSDVFEVQRQISNRRTNLPPGHWPWRLSEKVKIVLQPHVQCPSGQCEGAVRTPWLLVLWDDGGRSKVWDVYEEQEPGKWVKITDEWTHPHVDNRQQVCMGNATDVVQALTVGINPDSAYCGDNGVRRWFRDLDHYCSWSDPSRECYECGESFDEDDDIRFYSGIDEWICDRCFGNHFFTCDNCEETRSDVDMYRGPDDRAYCESCFYDRWTECEDCQQAVDRDEIVEVVELIYGTSRTRDRLVCDRCLDLDQNYAQCSHCDSWRRRGDLVEVESSGRLYCSGCVPEPEEGGGDD